MDKKLIRNKMYEKRCNLSKSFVEGKSKKILANLFKTNILNFNNILAYSDFKNEVKTGDIIEQLLNNRKKVYLPVCDIKTHTFAIQEISDINFDAQINFYGISEPKFSAVTNDKIDCAIIPGIAFDNYGNRIGFGKGYYDKFLCENKNIYKIALCYEFQIVDNISVQLHDLPMDLIVTEDRVIEISNS